MATDKELKGCAICVYMKVLPDPDPFDWFCDDDVKAVCEMSQAQMHESGEPNIAVGCRPYQVLKESSYVPKWCPCNGTPVPKPQFREDFARFYGDSKKDDVVKVGL